MKIQAYRDIASDVLKCANDYHACIDLDEQSAWIKRTRKIYENATTAECRRANKTDKERLVSALEAYRLVALAARQSLCAGHSAQVTTKPAKQYRANKYNRSASRSVRLSRAARSAMRRGYL